MMHYSCPVFKCTLGKYIITEFLAKFSVGKIIMLMNRKLNVFHAPNKNILRAKISNASRNPVTTYTAVFLISLKASNRRRS